MSLEVACAALERAGFNLVGTLTPDDYDRGVPEVWSLARVAPGSRGVLVVGNAGRALWPLFRASPEARLRRDPLDRYTQRVLGEVAETLPPPTGVALYKERRDQQYLPLMRLAERAGFGSPGRVGVLLHPIYGPWISIRGVLFVGFGVPFREPEPFDPSTGCPAPCAAACHGHVIGPRGVDVQGCFRTKLLERACRAACDARSACVLGPEHAFDSAQIAHHSRIRWRPSTVRRAAAVLLSRR